MVYDFLITKFDATTGKLLVGAVDAATSLAGLVSGSTSNAGTQQQVVQGTISTPDLRANAVTAAKIADGGVGTTQLADVGVTSGKIATGAVTVTQLGTDAVETAKIKDANVTSAKLATGAVTATQLGTDAVEAAKIKDLNVTTGKLADLAVTTAKINDNAVTGAKMVAGSAAGQLLISGDSPFTFAVKSMSGDATIDKDGVVTLATSLGQVEVEEQVAANTAAGAATATTWHDRGSAAGWVKTFDTLTSTFLTITSAKLVLLAGTYIIEGSAPAYKTDGHRVRITRYNSSDISQQVIYGSSEISAAADAIQTRSRICAKITFAAGDYFKLEHYATSAQATNGLGLPVNVASAVEIYAQVRIQKIG